MSATLTKPRVEMRNLAVLGYVIGLTHFAYKAGDHTSADLLEPGYWDDARDVLAPGDWIFVSGTGWCAQLYVRDDDQHLVVGLVAGIG